MTQTLDLYHGAPSANILSILDQGVMRPDSIGHQIFFSQRFEDVFVHGTETDLGASFAIKARVSIPAGASVERKAVHGNPLAVVVKTAIPLSAKVLELYVRAPSPDGFKLKIVNGIDPIRAYLLQSRKAGKAIV